MNEIMTTDLLITSGT